MNSVVAKSGGGRQVAPVSRQVATVSPFRKQLAALKRRPLSDLDNLGAEIDDVAATRQKLLDKEKYLVDWTPVGRLDEFKRKLEALKECGILDSAKRLAVRLDDYFLDEHDPNELASVFVAELVGAFPSGKPTDPEVYVKALIAEVAAVDPIYVEIETAVRAVRRKKTFLPAIAEVLAEIRNAESIWGARTDAILEFGDDVDRMTRRVSELREALDKRERERHERSNFAVGDRVRHMRFSANLGTGTVEHVEEDCLGVALSVRFDGGTTKVVTGKEVQKLLPGEKGYAVEQCVQCNNLTG